MKMGSGTWTALAAVTGLALSLPNAAFASDLGYTYAELRYLDVDFDAGSGADGVTGIGWYRLNDRLFLIGQLISLNFDTGIDATTYAAGGGLIQPLNDKWDAVATATYRHTELDSTIRDVSRDGYGLQLGFRGMPIPKIETRAFVNYVDVTKPDTSLQLGGDYFFSPAFCAGLTGEFLGDADTITLGVRYAFGN